MSKFFLLVVFALSGFASISVADKNPINVFQQVSPGIYRGARPGKAGVEYLKKIGVKTILNIDNYVYEVATELRDADRVGIKMLSYPVDSWYWPVDENINEILRELDNPKNYPIFVHCEHGQDRTGLVVALYRVHYQNWSPAKAYREMRNIGFHRSLFVLYEYYKARTGFRTLWDELLVK